MRQEISQSEKILLQAAKTPGHAYILISDPPPIADANRLAKAMQCESPAADETPHKPDLTACGACLSCRVFASGNHPDVFYVNPKKTKAIGVDDIREQIVLPMSEKPFRYRYKIFIIEQQMTPQAQNALLKTIEEPAPFGIFLLLSDKLELFLPTILSRCAVIKTENKPSEPNTEDEIEDMSEMRLFAEKTARDIALMDTAAVFGLYSRFDKWKNDIQVLLDLLYECLRTELEIANDIQAVLHRINAVAAAKKALTQNGNFQMTIETMLLKMKGA